MKLTTEIKFSENLHCINHCHRVLTIGSCFAENIGNKLKKIKFSTLINPFGITYNPISIKNCIQRIGNKDKIKIYELQSCQDIYSHFDFHGDFNRPNSEDSLEKINISIDTANAYISNPIQVMILTLGTSWVYTHLKTGKIVNNCHKIPSSEFSKRLLTNDEMTTALQAGIDIITKQSPDVFFIFTVSPIRHIRNGLVENQLSKSKLIQTCHELVGSNTNASYFPAYEIVMDELRDYRWYDADMIHPNQQAVDYIWGKFTEQYFDNPTQQYLKELNKIQQQLEHRIVHIETPSSQAFLKKIISDMDSLELRFPHVNFQEDREKVKANLL